MSVRILVAGIGNIFFGDDAFGVEVARRLAQRPLPSGVRVVDFGIRGLDLAYALLDGYDAVILVDAAPRGEPPGTLYVIEPDADCTVEETSALPVLDMHRLDPVKVLALAKSLGARVENLLLVGCQPLNVADDTHVVDGLSEPVAAAVDEAIRLIESRIAQFLQPRHGQASASPAANRSLQQQT